MKYLVFTACCFFVILIAISAKPQVTFYDGGTIDFSTFSFHSSVDRPNLQATWKYLFGSAARRAFCTTGIWVFHWGHGSENYGPSTIYRNEIWIGGCASYPADAYAGSFRFVGEFLETKLNLYSGTEFTYNATTITGNQSVVSTIFASLIVVGYESVELFRQPNYQGTSVCVEARPWPADYYTDIRDIASLNLQPGDVQSIRFGCSSKAVSINAPPIPRRVRSTSLFGNRF